MTSGQATILVSYDGSEVSKAVFGPAGRLAKLMQASVFLVQVFRAPPEIWSHPDAAHRESELARLQAELQQQVDAAAAEFSGQAGVSVEGQARMLGERWNIAGEILAAADEMNAETICMATHGETGIRRLFVGSVTQDVISESKRPVTLIRAGDDE